MTHTAAGAAIALALLAAGCSPRRPDRPSAVVPPVRESDVRWLEDLWLGCHRAVVADYDRAWADFRLDRGELAVVARDVARAHAADPAGAVCRFTHATPPVERRSRLRRLLDRAGYWSDDS